MNHQLYELIESNRDVLRARVSNQVQVPYAPHYQAREKLLLGVRVERLIQEYLDSVRTESTGFVDYVRNLADERFREGYRLSEIQMALNIFNEELWQLCSETEKDKYQLLRYLSQMYITIGAAKDQVAQMYLRQKEEELFH